VNDEKEDGMAQEKFWVYEGNNKSIEFITMKMSKRQVLKEKCG